MIIFVAMRLVFYLHSPASICSGLLISIIKLLTFIILSRVFAYANYHFWCLMIQLSVSLAFFQLNERGSY